MTHENVLGWLKVTLHRRILHELRKPSRTREQLYAEPDSSQVVNSKWVQQAFTAWEQETTLQDVMAVVDAILTPEERTVFQLFFLNDYSTEVDYSSYIGTGTYRVAGMFNADGHMITRYSNERTFK